MCGFFGNLYNKNFNRNYKKFLESSDLLSYRGPDDNHTFSDKILDLKFFRLSIRDLSKTGRQPMISRNNNYLICLNGEIYNSEFLKKKYLRNLDLKSTSDTEILLEAFVNKGHTIFNELEGMYSIFFYNIKNQSSYIVRDRFGIKPLYYKKNLNNFIFSSEIKPILNFDDKKALSKEGFSDFFFKGSLDHNKTFFKNIISLEPGNYLELKNNTILRQKKYWTLKERLFKGNIKSNENNLKNYFKSSVNKHLISDRKIGLFLSGGTDSTVLTKEISKLLDYKLSTFTYDFRNSGKFGEKDIAKKIATKLKVKNYTEIVKPSDIENNFERLINIVESPITSIRLFGVLKNYELAKKKKYKVIIEGHGGDEQLGGYTYNYIFYLLDEFRKKKKINNFINSLLFSNYLKKIDSNKLLNILITSTFQEGSTTDGTPFIDINFFNKDFINSVIYEDYYIEKKICSNLLKNSQMKDIRNIKLPRVLKYTDRLSMANGIETRVPFLDHKLFEFSFNLENTYKFRNGQARWIFKKVFENKIIRYNNKRSIVDPQTLWFKKDLKDFIYSIINSKEFKNSDYFNHKYVRKYFENFLKSRSDTSFNLIQIISTQIFLNKFFS